MFFLVGGGAHKPKKVIAVVVGVTIFRVGGGSSNEGIWIYWEHDIHMGIQRCLFEPTRGDMS